MNQGQRRCRIRCAGLAAMNAEAAPNETSVLPKRRRFRAPERRSAPMADARGARGTQSPIGAVSLADVHLLRRPLAVHDELVDVDAGRSLAAGAADFPVPVTDVVAAGQLEVLQELLATLDDRDGDELGEHVVDADRDDAIGPRSLLAREREGNVRVRIDGIRIVLSERPYLTPS